MRKAKVHTNARAEKGISKLAGCSIMMFIGIECGKAMLTSPIQSEDKAWLSGTTTTTINLFP
ncbi:hypothetical protein HMPREF0971_01409 [Segatella oris F0302]|uniref:Uncharacterized protein n=1 Tax=Segatella oris F0302 TaxID=649760 RepID=D1QR06_9BACT|nr:hypothetical protein HMPREF0971_01409 [Segatella oris F0302]